MDTPLARAVQLLSFELNDCRSSMHFPTRTLQRFMQLLRSARAIALSYH